MILSKRRPSVRLIVSTLLILLLNVPFRILSLLKIFLLSKNSIGEDVELLYHKLFLELCHLKIELYNDGVYLNCNNLRELIRKALMCGIPKDNLIQFYNAIKNERLERAKEKDELIHLKYGIITDKYGKELIKPHPMYQEDGMAIHATGNMPIHMRNIQFYRKNEETTQWVDKPILGAIRSNSKAPATVRSFNVKDGGYIDKSIIIPKKQLEEAKYDSPETFSSLDLSISDKIKKEREIMCQIIKFYSKNNYGHIDE